MAWAVVSFHDRVGVNKIIHGRVELWRDVTAEAEEISGALLEDLGQRDWWDFSSPSITFRQTVFEQDGATGSD